MAVIWFRRDLRVADNPAVQAAVESGRPVLPLYIEEAEAQAGAASRRRLDVALGRLGSALEGRGTPLVVRAGDPEDVLRRLHEKVEIASVSWNRSYEPGARATERRVIDALRSLGVDAHAFDGTVLFPPGSILNGSDKPYVVFTAFWNACMAKMKPGRPDIALDRERVTRVISDYHELRDRPDMAGTSRLSAALHFGEVSPRQAWHAAEGDGPGAQAFRRQLGWREFARHLLYHFPHTVEEPMRSEWKDFPWRDDPGALDAWKEGRTGYPIVDAGMRQLARTGWMHNRLRLITGSFLVKDLLVSWREGARHFEGMLEDYDLANNTLGWQWVAGCSADAAPYFRIFNPVLQSKKFDPDGAFVREWVPELGALNKQWIHEPWRAPEAALRDAGVEIGRDYPAPIVDHRHARERALAAYQELASAEKH